MKERDCIAFAYFADGKFIGWYADSFGSIRKAPKIYDNSSRQIEIITTNFTAKVRKAKGLQEHDFLSQAVEFVRPLNPVGAMIMEEKKSELSEYKDIELRIVECPIYDGPNPDHVEGDDKPWWIYANYDDVKAWASIEPVDFIGVIKSE